MLDKSALRQGSSGRQTAGSGSTPCRTDGVRLGLTSQRLKTRSLSKQSITRAVWALLTNLPFLPHTAGVIDESPSVRQHTPTWSAFYISQLKEIQDSGCFCLPEPLSCFIPPPPPSFLPLFFSLSLQVVVAGLFW